MKKSHAGYSLIELISALFIISLLVVLVTVGLTNILSRANSVTAASNLRSMGTALLLHATENNNQLLDGALGATLRTGELASSRGPAVAFWFNALDYYMGGNGNTLAGMLELERPDWQQDPAKRYNENLTSSAGYGVSVGFGWNHQYFGYDSVNSPDRGWATLLVNVERPGETIIVGTGEDSLNEGNSLRNVMIYANSIRCRRHNGGGYYLFLDGHVDQLTPEEVMHDESYFMRRIK
jgi:prepilin-type processing-associated H-X9-DG protein/prepilin-type N-terminal cleavage/methylation domain-containing protein